MDTSIPEIEISLILIEKNRFMLNNEKELWRIVLKAKVIDSINNIESETYN